MRKSKFFVKIKKANFIVPFFSAIVIVAPLSAFGSVVSATLCDGTTEVCNRGYKYACPNGNTSLYCPTGWTLSGSTCSRSNTTSSDSTGNYKMEYTSCSASTKTCYSGSSTSSTSGIGATLCFACQVSPVS